MKLIDGWRSELNRLWSIRMSVLACLFALCEVATEALPFLADSIPSRMFALLSAGAAIGAALSRLIKQA